MKNNDIAIRQYLQDMEKSGSWGDGTVLSAAAMLYNKTIFSENAIKPLNIDGSESIINELDASLQNEDNSVKLMTDEDSLRQDSLRQDSLKQRVAYHAPGFERSYARNGRKTH